MRFGIFGNTNNYPLLLARGLRALGHDVVLLVNRKERIHRPESRHPELADGYPSWILDCSDVTEDDFVAATPRIDPVLNVLGGWSDLVILNDLGPSLLEFCDVPALALLTGSDVTYYANPATTAVRHQSCSPAFTSTPAARMSRRRWTAFIERQRTGIRAAAAVSAPFSGLVPEIDVLLHHIGVDEARRGFVYVADTDVPPVSPARANRRLRIVNGARLNWKKPLPDGFSSQDHKGTDVLLDGFAQFIKAGHDADLVMFRKGLHVAETEAYAESLGIAGHLQWHDEVSLSEFHHQIAQADIVCDQFGDSFPGMVANDAMARGLPVIADFQPEIMAGHFPEPFAACQARTPDEVAAHLAALARSPKARTAAGRAARHFARTYLSPVANARRCLSLLGLGDRRTIDEPRTVAPKQPV